MKKYDLAIIGSGPGGYVAAIRAAQLGLKVCLFEKEKIGGVCLNWGCIPTKALSVSSSLYSSIQRADEFGIDVKDYNLNFSKVQERKEKIVKKLSSGIEMLIKARKVDLVKQKAKIKDATHVGFGDEEVEAKSILIATGSLPFEIPGMPFDGTHILSSSHMLALESVPKNIVIVGGGVIGCEFASIFRSFGSEVSIVEMMDQLLPNEDTEIVRKISEIFKKRGIKIFTKTKVETIEKKRGGINVALSGGTILRADKALVCVGRIPNTNDIGLENVGIECNKGWIKVDKHFKTNVKNIYAAGDVIGGILLAHVASREATSAVENISGKEKVLNYNAVPNCIFTQPEISSVGLNDKAAREQGLKTRTRKFLFSAIGKSHVLGETEGFIKLVVDDESDKILGAQLIGPRATELIAEFSPCVQFGITSEKLASVIHAHPTLSEVVQEVSEAMHSRAIHSL